MWDRKSITDEEADSGLTSFSPVNKMLVRQIIVRYPSSELSSPEARARFARKTPMSTKDEAGTVHQVSAISVLSIGAEIGMTFAWDSCAWTAFQDVQGRKWDGVASTACREKTEDTSNRDAINKDLNSGRRKSNVWWPPFPDWRTQTRAKPRLWPEYMVVHVRAMAHMEKMSGGNQTRKSAGIES